MKRFQLVILCIAQALGSFACTQSNDSGEQASNPVIWADVPDPSVIRVGDTYYMSSTTMHMSPGLPIMKSKDLVNWKLVSYAYDRLEENDALNLVNGKNAYGAGSWASSLRYHNGSFYVSTFSSTTGKTHIYKTSNIENDVWTESSFSPSLHDNSLFFDDDGRVYMIYGGGTLRLIELTADASAIKGGGVDQVIIENASEPAGENIMLKAEGSQLFKIDGTYYLLNIVWPRDGMRTTLIHRADEIAGPWEGRIALQYEGVAQGGLIDTPDGDWYAFLFQDHGAVGRVPYLVPVNWESGWPILGVNKQIPDTFKLPAAKGNLNGIVTSDEFDRQPDEPEFSLAWQWNHNPDSNHWSLTDRYGFLRLTSDRLDEDVLQTRNTLTQRTFGPESSATTAIDLGEMKDGNVAGIIALQKNYGFVGVHLENGQKSIIVEQVESGIPVETESIPLFQNKLYLKIECDFKNRTDKAYFYYSLDGSTWTRIGKPLQMKYTLPHFMGYRFGLFNYATKPPGGFVDFDYFRLSDTLSGKSNGQSKK